MLLEISKSIAHGDAPMDCQGMRSDVCTLVVNSITSQPAFPNFPIVCGLLIDLPDMFGIRPEIFSADFNVAEAAVDANFMLVRPHVQHSADLGLL